MAEIEGAIAAAPTRQCSTDIVEHFLAAASMVALASDMPVAQFHAAIRRHRHALHLLSRHFHALHDVPGQGVQDDGLAGNPPLRVVAKVSCREAECLLWTARGKSAWETAQVLGISERTVNFHVENARRKLNAQTKTQAVAQAIMQNLIRP